MSTQKRQQLLAVQARMRPAPRRRPPRARARRSRGGRRRHAGVTGRTMISSAGAEDVGVAAHRRPAARGRRARRCGRRRTGVSPLRSAMISAIRARSTSTVLSYHGRSSALGRGGERRDEVGGAVAVLAHDAAQDRGVGEAERHAAPHRRVRARPRVAEAEHAQGRPGAVAVERAQAVEDAAHRHHRRDRLARRASARGAGRRARPRSTSPGRAAPSAAGRRPRRRA